MLTSSEREQAAALAKVLAALEGLPLKVQERVLRAAAVLLGLDQGEGA